MKLNNLLLAKSGHEKKHLNHTGNVTETGYPIGALTALKSAVGTGKWCSVWTAVISGKLSVGVPSATTGG